MNVQILRAVKRMFNSELVSPELNRRNRRAYVTARRALGDKWLLARKKA